MKTIKLSALFLLLISGTMMAQNNYQDFYKKNKRNEGVETFSLNPSLFRLMLSKEDQELKDWLKKVDNVSFFVADYATEDLRKELNRSLHPKIYNDLMVVKEGSSTVVFKIKENKDIIEEVVMIATEGDELTVMCLTGWFTMEDAKALAGTVKDM